MPYSSTAELPSNTNNLPIAAKEVYMTAFNASMKDGKSEEECAKIAWSAVGNAGFKKVNDKWVKLEETASTYFYTVKLGETNELEIMRVGSWKHPLYGDLVITNTTLDEIIKHFEDNVRGIDVAIDLEHRGTAYKGAAVGWIKKLKKMGTKLLATVDWTQLGKEKIASGEYKYFSPEYQEKYVDNETGKVYNNVLLGGGLTNKPFIKKMAPVLLSEEVSNEFSKPATLNNEEEVSQMDKKLLDVLKLSENATQEEIAIAVQKLVDDTVKLSEQVTTLTSDKTALETKITDLTKDVETKKSENISLAERVVSIETKLRDAEWDKIVSTKLSEGKLTPAMAEKFKVAYLRDAAGTIALMECLPVIVKLGEQGTSQGTAELEKGQSIKLFEAEVEKTMNEQKMEYVDAMCYVEKTQPALTAAAYAERRGV